MPKLDDYYDFRNSLVGFLSEDLVGPSQPDELITDPPITRYLCGILFPRNNSSVPPESDTDLGDAEGDYDEVGGPDPAVSMSNVRYPSSCGLTFAVNPALTETLLVQVECGRYEPKSSEFVQGQGDDGEQVSISEEGEDSGDEIGGTAWRRVPVTVEPVTVPVRMPERGHRQRIDELGLTLFWRIREPGDDGSVAVTVVLLNDRSAPKAGLRDEYCYFQPRITVSAPGASSCAFTERPHRGTTGVDADADAYRLLYRSATNYAVGHGCAAEWDASVPPSDFRIRTTFIPTYELLISESNPRINPISMRELASRDRTRTVALLTDLASGFSDWIDAQDAQVPELERRLQGVARTHLAQCRMVCGRMMRGIELLADDDEVLTAFSLANRAMADQRARSVRIDEGKPDIDLDSVECTWRPFQIAFLLLCLEGVADPNSADRSLVDLLWFPTGGGKTEAYLGLIAFTVFLRRLRSGRGGVTALMRYTLRLLTAQQFERAAALICSCEALRRDRNDLGTDPISIGLWVGQGGTPNNLADAKKAITNLKGGRPAGDKGNPVQLHRCPRCGTPLDATNYWVRDARPRHLVVECKHPGCEFERGLPVFVVDDDIYEYRPTLLIGTVDKFASLPWNDKTANIFNSGSGSPPELIVQDELHLISGPLGTLTGLYETAVDMLCENSAGIGPKVVASTATIRRADDQSRGLFARDLCQFPPPGLTIEDSYFATTAPRSERGSRLYVGLMAPGSSHATLMIRTYAALLQSAAGIDADEEVRDPYWTLVGYFNSLRVLGGARMQVQDDVQDRMGLLASASGASRRELRQLPIEMTSRESSASIPDRLAQMKIAFPNPDAADVILATNMISVGVDIDRLGLMAIMGQPQSTAEYIQASSRVGRRHPGLVVTLFNSARSRDRSHYESFRPYHSALYRQVEATSVTPFSARARDRGIEAVLVALVRLNISGLRANDSAGKIADYLDEVRVFRDRIVARARQVSEGREAEATREQLDGFIGRWLERAERQPGLVYTAPFQLERALLVDAASEREDEFSVSALRSLRDVDQTSNLFLVRV
jgi:hypothetical protein